MAQKHRQTNRFTIAWRPTGRLTRLVLIHGFVTGLSAVVLSAAHAAATQSPTTKADNPSAASAKTKNPTQANKPQANKPTPKPAQKTADNTHPKNPATQPAPTITSDWTPLLNTMQNGCDLPDFDAATPEQIASILPADNQPDRLGAGYKTLNLQHATAWGYPIKKIQYGSLGAGFSSATVYFYDDSFMRLRDKFFITTTAGKLKASDKTVISDRNAFAGQYLANGYGYNDGRVGVNFNPKNHTITCSWAHLTS